MTNWFQTCYPQFFILTVLPWITVIHKYHDISWISTTLFYKLNKTLSINVFPKEILNIYSELGIFSTFALWRLNLLCYPTTSFFIKTSSINIFSKEILNNYSELGIFSTFALSRLNLLWHESQLVSIYLLWANAVISYYMLYFR